MSRAPLLPALSELARLPNLPTVWSNVLAAWVIAGAAPSPSLLAAIAGASLLYAGGCTLNDAFDAAWDARHRPERLIPSGRLPARVVWSAGLAELAAGTAILTALCPHHRLLPAALAAAILVYDAWHKQNPLSVLVMGACRWLLWLVAAAAATGSLTISAVAAGGVVWTAIVVLSLVARGEAKAGEKPPLSRHLLWLVPALVAAAACLPDISPVAPLAAAVGLTAAGAVWLRLPVSPASGRVDIGRWVGRMLAFLPVLDAALVLALTDPGAPGRALALTAAAVCAVAAVLLQRRFAAT